MRLYHGTRLVELEDKLKVCDFPVARRSTNGFGFFVTNNKAIAECYGNVVEWEVDNDWACKLARPITVHGNKGLEFVLSQAEADALVLNHTLSITIH